MDVSFQCMTKFTTNKKKIKKNKNKINKKQIIFFKKSKEKAQCQDWKFFHLMVIGLPSECHSEDLR